MQMRSVLALAVAVGVASGAQVNWRGVANNQQWGSSTNWYPPVVPGADDDVTINDEEGKDASVLLVYPTTVRSLTMGSLARSAYIRVLANLTVTGALDVRSNGTFEVDNGAATVTATDATISGELAFFAGTLNRGPFNVKGHANFGTPDAKVFDSVSVVITSALPVDAMGALYFKGNSSVRANSSLRAQGSNFQCFVTDDSTSNKFVTDGFTWMQ
eukprot:TRINITY_DN67862_c0_g1_i1.p1 TRINITY_DN67862_c0_g1~~TRINITY_DN67862_c0_g1_i1.p1  ORF type:complete len:215 (+),score=63.44 TRINITY_DN67862_c0_g1_i1:67-711(+)